MEAFLVVGQNIQTKSEVFGDGSANGAGQLILFLRSYVRSDLTFETLHVGAAGDVLDRPRKCAATVEGALGTLHDFDPLHVQKPLVNEETTTVGADSFTGEINAVHQKSGVGPAPAGRETADDHPGVLATVPLVPLDARGVLGHILYIGDALTFYLGPADGRDGDGHLLEVFRFLAGNDHDLFELCPGRAYRHQARGRAHHHVED